MPCPYRFKGGVDIQTFKRKKQKTATGLLTGAVTLPEVGVGISRHHSRGVQSHMVDHDLAEAGAADLGGAIHQPREVVGHLLAVDLFDKYF